MADATKTLQIIIDAKDNATSVLDGFSKKMDTFSANVSKVGRSMALIGAAPTAALAGASKAAIDFESSFAGVRKTVDASEAEFTQLAQNFRNISKETPLAVTDLNRIGEIAGSLGISGVDNLTKFTKTIAQIGITTNLTEEEAAMSFGRIANIMQEPIKNVDRMGATVVDLGNKFAATERDITDFSERIAGAAKISGLSTKDVFGISTAMASVGIEAEAGGTAVQKVLLSIKKSIATGNSDLEIYAKTAGITGEQFKKAWETSPGEAFTAFVMGLGKQGDKAITTLSDLGLEDQRLIRSFLSLSNAGDLINKSMNSAGDAWSKNTALTTEAEKRYATTASQVQIFKNNIFDLGITIGSFLLPAINKIFKAIKPFVEKIASFAQEHPKLIVGMIILGTIIGALGAALIVVAAILPGLMTLFGAIGAVIGVLAGPVGIIVVGILAIAAAAIFLIKKFELWDDIKRIVGNFIQHLKEMPGTILTFFEEASTNIQTFVTNTINFFKQLPDQIGAFIEKLFIQDIPYAVGFLAGWIVTNLPLLIDNIIKWFEELPSNILNVFTRIYDSVVAKMTEMVLWLMITFLALPGQIKSWINSIPNIVSGIFESAKKAVLDKMSEMFDGVSEWWGKIKGVLESIQNAANKAIDSVKKGFEAGKGKVSFQHGGFVPGSYNTAVPAILHGGERIIPRVGTDVNPGMGGGGGGSSVNINISGSFNLDSDTRVQEFADKVIRIIGRQNELAGKGIGV